MKSAIIMRSNHKNFLKILSNREGIGKTTYLTQMARIMALDKSSAFIIKRHLEWAGLIKTKKKGRYSFMEIRKVSKVSGGKEDGC